MDTFKKKLQIADEVKGIVLDKIDIIKDYIAEIKEELIANFSTDEQDGCLDGEIDDFIKEEDFDALFDNLIDQLAKNDEDLQKKIDGTDSSYKTQLIDQCDEIHGRLKSMFVKETLMELKHLPNFGSPLPDDPYNFLWPSPTDLDKLNLKDPLQLKAIRTLGVLGSGPSAIQLIFDNNIESPLIDSKNSGASEDVSTVELQRKAVSKIVARTCRNGWIGNLRFIYDDGSVQTIYDKKSNNRFHNDQTVQVPKNHHIVGVYGFCRPNSMLRYIGFIVVEK